MPSQRPLGRPYRPTKCKNPLPAPSGRPGAIPCRVDGWRARPTRARTKSENGLEHTQNVWWRNSSAPGTFSGLFPRVRAYADPKPLPQADGVRHRYTRTPPPRHSPGWLGGTLRAGPGPLIDPPGAHAGPGPTPPIPPLGHPTRHPALVIWLRKRRLAGHPKNVLKNAAPRFDPPALLILYRGSPI